MDSKPKLAGKPKGKKKKLGPLGVPSEEAVKAATAQTGAVGEALGIPAPSVESASPAEEKVEKEAAIPAESPTAEASPAEEKVPAPAAEATHTGTGVAMLSVNKKTEKGEITVKSYDEVLTVERFLTEPARVQVELGITVNMGNFESARVSASVSLPCYKEQIDKAYDYAKKWLATRVAAEVEQIRSKQNGKPGMPTTPLF